MIHVLLAIYIFGLLYTFWPSWKVHCIRELNVWLSVYFIVELLQITVSLFAVCVWYRANDPTMAETRLYVFGTFWLYLFMATWIIYGSTFIYSDEISQCVDTTFEIFGDTVQRVAELRITALVLIVLGYLNLIGILLLACAGCCMYCVYKSWTKVDALTNDGQVFETKEKTERRKLHIR